MSDQGGRALFKIFYVEQNVDEGGDFNRLRMFFSI